ncbi:unnamed protein product [Brachionus calyciflorus]|uniref:Uncharacterized protein n=1 Tax=Brachionus calyciflorus TaxID=104777 RepID=A0A813MRH6_9BILA|nr:unnamed protein product [Brachionus calyciflorus]
MPSTSSGSLILPIVLWDNNPPECQISSMLINETEKYIFTGTTSGHIIIWDFNIDEITPVCLMIGHTSVVNCLAKAGSTKDEEYIVSSSENGEMKLWEINEKKCIENIKMSNTIHKHIYSSKLSGRYTRLFCIGNYTDVLVIDPISLDILYTLVSREKHEWIKALCINSLSNKQDDVIVGVSVTGTIKLWTLSANEVKGSEIVEHEFKSSLCENASTLASCPGKQRIFIIVCPTFFQIFDAVDFTVLCQVNTSSLVQDETINFTNGFFIDINNVLVCTSDGMAYLYSLPENINPSSPVFRKSSGLVGTDKYFKANLVCKFNSFDSTDRILTEKTKIKHFFCSPIFYFYELRKRTTPLYTQNDSTHPPATTQRFLIKGDSFSQLSVWNLNINSNLTRSSDYKTSLKKFWSENFRQDNETVGSISTLLYLSKIDKIVYGMNDGSIVIVPAIDFLIKSLFRRRLNERTHIIKLKKHTAKVTCILYPHAEHTRYDPTILVTGSLDFSIILWNINTGEMIHKFVVQTGEILQLSVPPNNVNPRILQCICSISSDHSVALLSLKECKPVMIASRHLFPVLFVKWRPLDDYLIVKCSDGGVFVWQIETGNLDRVAHGLVAEDILNAADEIVNNPDNFSPQSPTANVFIPTQVSNNIISQALNNPSAYISHSTPMIISNKSISNQTIALAHTLQKRNFSHAIKAISQKLASTKEDPKKVLPVIDSSSINYPLVIQPFHLSSNDPVKHLILFDIDALLTTLVLEEYAIDATLKQLKSSLYRDAHNASSAPAPLILPSQRINTEFTQNALKRNASAKLLDSIDIKQLNSFKSKINYAKSIIDLTHILLSSLHVWSIDQSADEKFSEQFSLQKPKYPISFGRISRGAHLFVMFPPKKASFNFEQADGISATSSMNEIKSDVSSPTRMVSTKSFNLIDFDSEEELIRKSASNSSYSVASLPRGNSMQIFESRKLATPSPTREYWLSIKSITTEHLLAILAISNSFMHLNSFIDLQVKKE